MTADSVRMPPQREFRPKGFETLHRGATGGMEKRCRPLPLGGAGMVTTVGAWIPAGRDFDGHVSVQHESADGDFPFLAPSGRCRLGGHGRGAPGR